jgi:hypothetical protein
VPQYVDGLQPLTLRRIDHCHQRASQVCCGHRREQFPRRHADTEKLPSEISHNSQHDDTVHLRKLLPFYTFSGYTGNCKMMNVVFWNIKTHFVLHRRHITSPLQSPTG